MTLGQHLQTKRKAIKLPYGKKVSVRDMASEIGVSASSLWSIETDRSEPLLSTARKIAKAYGTTIDAMAELAKERS